MEINIFDDLGVEENILKWTLKKYDGTVYTGFNWLSNVMDKVCSLVTTTECL
jgi:hypothetical protein